MMTENPNPADQPNDDEMFAQLVGPLELARAELAFAHQLQWYVAKIDELKGQIPWGAVIAPLTMGRMMLVVLAMNVFHLDEYEAAKVVEDGILAERKLA